MTFAWKLAVALAGAAVVTAVVLAASPASGQPAASIEVRDFAFAPDNISIDVGGTVTWTNVSGSNHSITTTNTDDFSHGASCPLLFQDCLTPNESHSHTFASPGRYDYRCGVHPSTMTGVILVGVDATTTTTASTGTTVTSSSTSTTRSTGATTTTTDDDDGSSTSSTSSTSSPASDSSSSSTTRRSTTTTDADEDAAPGDIGGDGDDDDEQNPLVVALAVLLTGVVMAATASVFRQLRRVN